MKTNHAIEMRKWREEKKTALRARVEEAAAIAAAQEAEADEFAAINRNAKRLGLASRVEAATAPTAKEEFIESLTASGVSVTSFLHFGAQRRNALVASVNEIADQVEPAQFSAYEAELREAKKQELASKVRAVRQEYLIASALEEALEQTCEGETCVFTSMAHGDHLITVIAPRGMVEGL